MFKQRHFANNYEGEIRRVAKEFDLELPKQRIRLEDENVTEKSEKKKSKSKKRKHSEITVAFDDDDASDNDTERSSKRPKIVHGCAGTININENIHSKFLKLHFLIPDNAHNAQLALDNLGIDHDGCSPHTINLVAEESVKASKEIKGLRAKIKPTINFTRTSSNGKIFLKQCQETCGLRKY